MEGRDSVLYLVDARLPILKQCLAMVSRAIRDVAKQSLVCDAGVVLYNVRGQPKHVRTLLRLGVPKIDDLKAFIRFVDGSGQVNEIQPSSDEDSLLDVLRTAKSELNQLRFRSMRRVVLITANSDPFLGDKQKYAIAASLTSDITNSPALINPIFIKNPDFNVSTFWATLNYLPPFYQQHFTLFDPLTRFALDPVSPDSLSASNHNIVLSKSRRKHYVFRGKLTVHNIQIGIKGFNIVQPKNRVPTAKDVAVLTSKTGAQHRELLHSESSHVVASTGAEINLQSSQSFRAFKLSGSVNESDWIVNVSEKEWNDLHTFEESEDTIFEITSFVKSARLGSLQTVSVGHSTLLVPCDDRLGNSSDAFATLHRSMNRKKVAAIITMHHPKHRNSPSMQGIAYASNPAPHIFPNQRELSPTAGSGLFFVPVPFLDDIRFHEELAGPPTDGMLVRHFQQLVHKFRLPSGFDPYRFPNPKAAQFANILEHHALNIPLDTTEDGKLKETPDPTRPRYAKIKEGSGQLLKTLAEIYTDRAPPPAPSPAKKRKATEATEADDKDTLIEDFQSNQLEKYTVVRLIKALDMLDVPHKRERKAILIDKLKAHIRENLLDEKPEDF